LAKVAIPDAVDDDGRVTSRRLALRAFASWSLDPGGVDPGGADGPEPAAGADGGERGDLIDKWRRALAAEYEAAPADRPADDRRHGGSSRARPRSRFVPRLPG